MAITSIQNQVVPSGQQPFANQSTLGPVIGECADYHSAITAPIVTAFINNAVRDYYDRRYWYGLLRKGEFNSPGYYSTGTINLVNGSSTVQGTNTNWTSVLNGASITLQQLRVGFTAPVLNIIGLDAVNQILTLELPWGLPSVTSSGYFITQYYFSVPNIKYIYSCKNLQMMYRMWTNVPQNLIENWDPSRLQLMYPRIVATMPPDASGNYQIEMWPAPNTQQSFPYLAYCQPDNLTDDNDIFPAFCRIDAIKSRVIADVLRYRPKTNTYYSEAMASSIAGEKMKEYEALYATAASADEGLWRADVVLVEEQMPMANLDWSTGMLLGGATLAAMTPVFEDGY